MIDMRRKLTDINTLFYELWFPKNTQDITIIASPEYELSKDAQLTSPNYALLDRLGDRDTVFALGKLLSRKYPRAAIHLISSKDISHSQLNLNTVVIGGPGGLAMNPETNVLEEFEGNEACKIFSKIIDTCISYSDDCAKMKFEENLLESLYDHQKYMKLDYGYFAMFPNPFQKRAKVILLHGIHTLGVLGAARIYDGEVDSEHNLRMVKDFFRKSGSEEIGPFESYFQVKVVKGEVICPDSDDTCIFHLGKKIKLSESAPTVTTENEAALQGRGEQLRTKAEGIIHDALQFANSNTKKNNLQFLKEKVGAVSVLNTTLLQEIVNVLDQNTYIPDENVSRILALTDNG